MKKGHRAGIKAENSWKGIHGKSRRDDLIGRGGVPWERKGSRKLKKDYVLGTGNRPFC